jgi:translocation and assembly module TamA
LRAAAGFSSEIGIRVAPLTRMRMGAMAVLSVCQVVLAGCAAENAGRPWVRRMVIEGAPSVNGKDLRSRLAVQQTNCLRVPKRRLDPYAVERDRARIEAYYHAHGFFAAQVTVAEVIARSGPPDRPTSVDVRFVVDEGLPSTIRGLEIRGLAGVASEEAMIEALRERLPEGAVFDHGRYLEAKRELEHALLDAGHAFAVVEGRVDVDLLTHTADVHFFVQPGPIARFGELRIDGIGRLPAPQILRQSRIDPGQRFDPAALDDARGRLYHLGVFSSVRIEYARSPIDPQLADVLIHVREAPLRTLRLGAGVGLEAFRTDVHGVVDFTQQNWLGGLRTLELRLEPGWVAVPAFWDVQRSGPALVADVQLTQPDWPLPRGQLRLAAGYDVGVDYAYQFRGPRARVGLSRNLWHDNVALSISYNFQFLQFFDTDPAILDNPALAGRLFGFTDPYRLGWFQEEIALDLRDRPLAARRGLYAAVAFEQGGAYAGGAFRYEKIVPELRLYAPLGSRVTVAGRFLYGQLFSQGDLGSPTTRRFYLGGFNTHRGFNYDRLSPQVPSGQPGTSPIPIGGDQMVLVTGELRIDVARLLGRWLSLVAFVDGGDVGGPSCAGTITCTSVSLRTSVDWGDLNWAAGGGFRYQSQIGTVSADLGVRLNRLAPTQPDGTPNADPGRRFAFHVFLGEAF